MGERSEVHKVMDQLLADFKCAICVEVYIDATLTNCGHVFCRFCINKWKQFKNRCPECHELLTDCRPAENIDAEVDGLFQQLPSSILRERDEVILRRHKLEAEGVGIIKQTSLLVDELRTQRISPIASNITNSQEESSGLSKQNSSVPEIERLQLPRLVPEGKPSEDHLGHTNVNTYENVKLPPLKLPMRNSRGVTTTTCAQNTSDKFPKGMEGDIPTEFTTADSIRELERRNEILENELFGAYDRIMNAIQENDAAVVENVDPNVFVNSSPAAHKQNPKFSKESIIVGGTDAEAKEKEDQSNDVNDLLAETEELIEIEDFLKKYPFERIRDDETLVNYEFDNDIESDDAKLDILNPNQMEEMPPHRASKKPLTEAQQEIENFYKKLESKQKVQKENFGHGPRLSKGATQPTTSSKLKRIPPFRKFNRDPPNVPPVIPAEINKSTSAKSRPKATVDHKINDNSHFPDNKLQKTNSISTPSGAAVPEKHTSKASLPDKSTKSISEQCRQAASKYLPYESKRSASTMSFIDKIADKKAWRSDQSGQRVNSSIPGKRSFKIATDISDKPRESSVQELIMESDENLKYDDFLKLEIDFLDGDGDWKNFERPPVEMPGRLRFFNSKDLAAVDHMQERRRQQDHKNNNDSTNPRKSSFTFASPSSHAKISKNLNLVASPGRSRK